MTADRTGPLLWNWVLQIAWWLAAMLPLAAAGILIALGLRAVHRRARTIEKKPVASTPGGFVQLLRDKFTHQALGQSMLFIILGGLALGGVVGMFLLRVIQPGVKQAIGPGDLLKQGTEGTAAPAANGPSLDFIFLLALVAGAITVVVAVHRYRTLCRRAADLAGSLTGREAQRPLLVRWFHDSKKMGLVALVIGAWVCFGMIMQVVGLIVVVVPWPAGLTDVSLPWATNAVIWIVVAVGVAFFLALLAPPVWMGVRHFKLEIRYYRENPTFRLLTNVSTALGAGLIGALLFMNLVSRLGISPLSGQWFDFITPVWTLAYLLAYAAALLLQIFICRSRERDFNLLNIAVAFIVAFPGSVPLFYPVLSLLTHLFYPLFGQPQ
jgi:hypothetical protein